MKLADSVEGEGGDVCECGVESLDVVRNPDERALADVVHRLRVRHDAGDVHRSFVFERVELMSRPVDDDAVAGFVEGDFGTDFDDFSGGAVTRRVGEGRVGVVHIHRPCAFRSGTDDGVHGADKHLISDGIRNFTRFQCGIAGGLHDDFVVFHCCLL